MKKAYAIFFVLMSLFIGIATAIAAERPQGLPKEFNKSQRVNDLAQVLGSNPSELRGTKDSLTQALKAVERSTGAQICILTVPKIPEGDLKGFSIAVARYWGCGQAGFGSDGKSNGLLVLIGKEDKRLRIEVGDGLEGILPDGKVGGIIRDARDLIVGENYGPMVQKIVGEISTVLFTEKKVTKESPKHSIKGEPDSKASAMWIGFVVLYVVAGLVGLIHWGFGTVVGGGGSGALALMVYGPGAIEVVVLWTIGGLLMGSIAWFLIQVVGIPGLGGGGSGGGDGFSGGGGTFSGGGAD